MIVRSTDPKFLPPRARWLLRLGQELAPLQIGNGGPIIVIQVENEYGSFGDDHAYMEQIHHDLVDAGFTSAALHRRRRRRGSQRSLPELPAAINFGPGEAQGRPSRTLQKLRPNGPFMTGEYWDGWFDHWGGTHHTTDTATAG